MQRNNLKIEARWIANSLVGLALLSGLPLAAEIPGVRFSSPTLGWVLAPGGTQGIEIAGVAESPRTGSAIALPSAARHLWSSPDASQVLVQVDGALYLLRPGGEPELLAELPGDAAVSAAWDRASTAVVACWDSACRAFGSATTQWEVPSGSVALAYSTSAGLLTASGDRAQWNTGTGTIPLEERPAAAAFRPGTEELWTISTTGRLAVQSRQGAQAIEGETVSDPIGLVANVDGSAFFMVNAEGAAATCQTANQQIERSEIGDTVEGAWPAPGAFTVRLHDSAKRAIAIWNGETGVTAWAPAAAVTAEVRQ